MLDTHACCVKEAKQLEEARLKLAREQKKRQDMDSAGRLAAQRKAAEQAVRQQAEADMKQKKADRQSRVCLHNHTLCSLFCNCSESMNQYTLTLDTLMPVCRQHYT